MKRHLYRICSFVWRNSVLRVWRGAKRLLREWEQSERRVSRGFEMRDKVFFVIRRRDNVGGLFAIYRDVLTKLNYALSKGYIPIVDLQNCRTYYQEEEEYKKNNVWEKYFMQPAGYKLEDIKYAKNVILSSKDSDDSLPAWDVSFLLGEKKEYFIYKELSQKFLGINQDVQKKVEARMVKLFDKDDKVLGVLCRGTDYTARKPKGHPIQPEVQALIKKSQDMMDKNCCTKLFLATEDKDSYLLFAEAFGEKLRTVNDDFVDYQGGSIGDDLHGYVVGLEYLVAMMILSRCSCFCGGITTGTMGVMFFTNGFEDVYLYDLGLY